MPAERLPMRQVREVLRLKYFSGQSGHRIAAAVGISRYTVAEYLRRAGGRGAKDLQAMRLVRLGDVQQHLLVVKREHIRRQEAALRIGLAAVRSTKTRILDTPVGTT